MVLLPTVTEYLDDWIELQRLRLQPATWDAYRQTIACHLAPAIGEIALDRLDPDTTRADVQICSFTAVVVAVGLPSAPSATSMRSNANA
jgi:hypothetical protein